MPIFRAIGLGILIITLRLLMPDVLDEGEHTAISFLRGARIGADTASSIAATAASANISPNTPQPIPHLLLPQASLPSSP